MLDLFILATGIAIGALVMWVYMDCKLIDKEYEMCAFYDSKIFDIIKEKLGGK